MEFRLTERERERNNVFPLRIGFKLGFNNYFIIYSILKLIKLLAWSFYFFFFIDKKKFLYNLGFKTKKKLPKNSLY